MPQKTAKQILQGARDLIADPKHWTKFALAKDAGGTEIEVFSDKACAFCLIGALRRSGPDYTSVRANGDLGFIEARKLLLQELGRSTIDGFNDYYQTTHADVLGVLDKAIENA